MPSSKKFFFSLILLLLTGFLLPKNVSAQTCSATIFTDTGCWNSYGFGCLTDTNTVFKVYNAAAGQLYWWKFGSGLWVASTTANKEITKNFGKSPGEYQISVCYVDQFSGINPNNTQDGVTNCNTSSAVTTPAKAFVYNNCGTGVFNQGTTITAAPGTSTYTCTTPAVGGCVGGATFWVNYSGTGQWGYYGWGTTRTGSASMKDIPVGGGGAWAGPNYAAYPPPYGTYGVTDSYGATCFRVDGGVGGSGATLQVVVPGSIYCRTGSCSGGGSGSTDPNITNFSVVAGSCKDYSGTFRCQLLATAHFGNPGTYRFGGMTGDYSLNPAIFDNICSNQAGGVYQDIGYDFDNTRSVKFKVTETTQLEKVRLFLKGTGTGTYWLNMKISVFNGSWNQQDPVSPPLVGLNGAVAEAGATLASTFTGWVDFSFLGSRPQLIAGTPYRIYIEYSPGMGGTTAPQWYNRKYYGDPVCTGTDYRRYEVYVNTASSAGEFSAGGIPTNPLFPVCDTTSPCDIVWWTPSGSGTHSLTADLLVTYPSNPYPLLPDKVGKRATTKTLLTTVTVPVNPWFQIKGGDVHAEGGITSNIPITATEKAFITDLNGYPGLVSLTGSADFSPASITSSTNWLANDSFTPATAFSYDYFYKKLGSPTVGNFTCLSNCPIPPAGGTILADGTVLYYSLDDITVVGQGWTIPANTKVIVLVDKDLFIKKQIAVPVGSFLMFIVKGNINIQGNVGDKNPVGTPHIQGVYFTDGTINTNSDNDTVSGARLVGAGSFIARSGFVLGRDIKDLKETLPAELFISRPDFMVNAPSVLFSSSLNWQEVSP